jgi:hypothetical protein
VGNLNALDLQQTVLLVIKMIQLSTKSYKLELKTYKIPKMITNSITQIIHKLFHILVNNCALMGSIQTLTPQIYVYYVPQIVRLA